MLRQRYSFNYAFRVEKWLFDPFDEHLSRLLQQLFMDEWLVSGIPFHLSAD